MAFGQEEVERRRQQREALRAKRMQEQQRLIRRLIAAGVVLAVAAVVILIVVLSGRSKDDPKPKKETQTQTQSAHREEKPKTGKTVVHFAAAGDLNVTDKVVSAGGTQLDYDAVIGDVLPLLADADLTAINFEGTVVGAPYGTATASAPVQLLEALKTAGVDMVQVANSRTISGGITGLATTLRTIRSVGIEPLGAYATEDDYEENGGYTIWEVEGVRIAVVAFTKGMDNMALPTGSEECVNLLYTDYSSTYVEINEKRITQVLDRVNKEEPDVVIAMLHWGSEYNDTHSTSQKEIVTLMQENGVDAIIGTHPHYVQEIDFSRKAGTVVAYSLGDFLGDGERSGTEYSLVLDLEITKDNKSGEAKITNCSYTPIFTYTNSDGLLRVVRIRQAMTAYEGNYLDSVPQQTYEAMGYAIQRLKDRTGMD